VAGAVAGADPAGSLLTALTPEQLRFILLHELAHIRRGDYLVNLCQLLVEALLFFNPAVWWLSRQIRLEREACCDAVAIERSGAPTEYARTLLHVAERYAAGEPTAAWRLGPAGTVGSGRAHPRLLSRTTGAPAADLAGDGRVAVGGVRIVVLMAVGTRITVEAILTPQERMDRHRKSVGGKWSAADADVCRPMTIPPARTSPFPVVSGRRTAAAAEYLWINQHLQGRATRVMAPAC